MKTVKVFNTNTCKWDTYKRNICGCWKKVVKPVCEKPVVVKQVCRPVVYDCTYEYVEYATC